MCIDESVIVDQSQMQLKNMNRVPVARLIERSVELGSQSGVDAVVLSCCDMPTLEAIPKIEAMVGKPTISSTQALFWRAIRMVGIRDVIKRSGRLFLEN